VVKLRSNCGQIGRVAPPPPAAPCAVDLRRAPPFNKQSNGGQTVAKLWPKCGQTVVKSVERVSSPPPLDAACSAPSVLAPPKVDKWSNCGQTVVKLWSNCGQTVVKLWSNCGQTVVNPSCARPSKGSSASPPASLPARPRPPLPTAHPAGLSRMRALGLAQSPPSLTTI
jgi:hypothetical protein